jgi:dienelactone hydrolase
MFLKNTFPIFFFVTMLILASCGNNESAKEKDETAEQNKLTAGTIISSQECRSNPEHTYAYYLPSSYSAEKQYPVIIAYDALARGYLSVSKFKNAAEKYGYIIVGSNDARNGLRDINPVINSLWEDVMGRFSIDQKRIYAAGFSGGARIAASVAIYKGGVKGVIGCAGGMPSVGQEIGKKFDFIGIVGLNDFNYQEMKTLDKAMTENGFTNQLLTFYGGHEWPPQDVLSKAIEWLDLMNMKKGELAIDDNLVRNYTASYADTINTAQIMGEYFKAYQFYNILLKDLDGLYDISEYQKSYNELLKNPTINESLNLEKVEKEKEHNDQEKLLNYFKSNNFTKIKEEINRLKKNATQSHINKRLLGFIGMLSYLYTEQAVNSQNIPAYKGFIDIYELIEPQNPDMECFKACQAMMESNKDIAMGHLQKAINYGFHDFRKLENIGYFQELRTLPEFDILVQKARQNAMKPSWRDL